MNFNDFVLMMERVIYFVILCGFFFGYFVDVIENIMRDMSD